MIEGKQKLPCLLSKTDPSFLSFFYLRFFSLFAKLSSAFRDCQQPKNQIAASIFLEEVANLFVHLSCQKKKPGLYFLLRLFNGPTWSTSFLPPFIGQGCPVEEWMMAWIMTWKRDHTRCHAGQGVVGACKLALHSRRYFRMRS